MSTVNVGNKGEELACQYLEKLGYQILERNFRIQGGEIDIVAKDNNYLVFIEVKTRYSHEYGVPVESMTPWKIKYLLKTAKFYILKTGWRDKPYRLDFIGVDFADNSDKPKIELIKNITS